jgi:hypothetical protein
MWKSLAFRLLLIAAASSTFAQSADRDRPTPLNSNEISGQLGVGDRDSYYSFSAGPGELNITVNVKSAGHSTGITFDLSDQKVGGHMLLRSTRAQADGGSTRKSVSASIVDRQTVVLHLSQSALDGAGTYTMQLSGAINHPPGNNSMGSSPQGDRSATKIVDRNYILALSATNRFLNAWRMRDQDAGLSMLSGRVKQQPLDNLRSYISGLSSPHHEAFEIFNGRSLPGGRFAFDVRLYEYYKDQDDSAEVPKPSRIVLVKNSAQEWLVDELPEEK